MKCSPEAVALIDKYADEEELTYEEEQRLKGHLQSCKDCQQYFHDIKKTIALVQSIGKAGAPSGFTENVMGRLPKEKRSVSYRRWFKNHPLMTAAALFIILMAGSLVSIWNDEEQLTVSKQENIQIQDNTVIVPEGKVVEGDLIVKNGNVKIEGEVRGNVVVINGERYLASAGNVTGEMEEVNQVFDWVWYHIKQFFKDAVGIFDSK